MNMFKYAAPLFHCYADRWAADDVETLSASIASKAGDCGAVLDVGGGTGALAVRLADRLGATVTVLDPSPEMLGYVPHRPDIRPVSGVAEAMPFEDGAFDAAVITDAFHHFRDQAGAVAEMTRVVRPGGAIAILELDPTSVAMRVLAFGERLLGEPAAFFTPQGMCDFMAGHGVAGSCERTKGFGYRYVGIVGDGAAAARPGTTPS